MVSLMSRMAILSRTKCFLFAYMYIHVDLLKLKTYKLFENSDADLSWLLFSTPEHNVLRGSYCDRSSSGVRPSVRLSVRPSVRLSVNNFFKNLLLQNQKANLDKTWQECSLGEALQKLLTEFNSNKNSGCHGNKMAENGKNL